MIAPYFAPQASVGAYRSVKMARHLPARGYRPIVLAGTFPSDARDEDLLRTLPAEVVVRDEYLSAPLLRARAAVASLARRLSAGGRPEPRQRRGLDPFRGLAERYTIHAPHALAAAVRLGREHRVALVYASLGPFAAAPVALGAARRLGVPAVLDLRDPWSLHESGGEHARASVAARLRGAAMRRAEAAWFRGAAAVVLNTAAALDAYREAYPELAHKMSFIRNGFDLGLHRPAEAPRERGPFRVLHLGTLRNDAPAEDLVAGLRLLVERERLSPAEIELVQIGHIGAHERELVDRAGLAGYFRVRERVPYADVLAEMRAANLLVVAQTPEVRLRIQAKTYDYVASGMPVLAISPNRELDAILTARADHRRVAPGDAEGVASVLAGHLEELRRSGRLPVPAPPPAELSAEAGARRLGDLFDSLC